MERVQIDKVELEKLLEIARDDRKIINDLVYELSDHGKEIDDFINKLAEKYCE